MSTGKNGRKHHTAHGWYYMRYRKYVERRVKIPKSNYVPTSFHDGYNEMTELIFRCWFRGVSPSTCIELLRVLNLERIPCPP